MGIDNLKHTWELLLVEGMTDEESKLLLEGSGTTSCRFATPRLNYMGPECADIQHATKEAARHISASRTFDMSGLRNIGQYLAGRLRLVSHFKLQTLPSVITGYTDSDWAGCMAKGQEHERRHHEHRHPCDQIV